jgi:hypothetical protein
LLDILRPPQADTGFITMADLEQAERARAPLCDEAHLQVFRLWYEFGGRKRPLTPVEAAEMPADLAKDFVYLLKRMRQLADSEIALGEWVNSNIFKQVEQCDALYPPSNPWE